MTRRKLDRDAWDLFHRCFKRGEEVFVITDDDGVHWGRLGAVTEDEFVLSRPGGVAASLKWWDIRWMSHDGFPVRRLLGADGSPSLEREPSVADAIRVAHAATFGVDGPFRGDLEAAHGRIAALESEIRTLRKNAIDWDAVEERNVEIKRLREEVSVTRAREAGVESVRRTRFGDPFEAESVASELFNPGNVGFAHHLANDEECLVLRAADGAVAQLFDLPTVYLLELGTSDLDF